MTRLSRLPIILTALLVILALPAPVQAAIPGAARHDLLVLRTVRSGHAELTTLPATGDHAALRLPLGLFASSGQTLYAATPLSAGARTLVQAIGAASGKTLRAFTIAGTYSTASGNYSAATLSYNGRWLALRASTSTVHSTRIIVIDTVAMRVVARVRLNGHFGLDALAPNGDPLYLIETLMGHGPYAYRVRSYQVRAGVLDPNPVVDKGESVGTMSGVAWTRAWAPGGDWLFTLYVHPGHGGAFIHALGVEYHLAHCIDLPSDGADAAQLAHYALAVAPDGSALYAINPVLGRAVVVRGSLPFSTPQPITLATRTTTAARTLHGVAVSPNGGTLYVATNRGIWVMDSASLHIRATYLSGRHIASVALSRDGQRLYALDSARGLVAAVAAATGHALGSVPAASGSWAIEQVMDKEQGIRR